jgi:hypothetical protein
MSTKTYSDVTQAVWDCMKASSIKDRNTAYDPPDANQGTATTDTAVGTVVLEFSFDPAAATVEYTIKSKPILVLESEVWNGIQNSVASCSQ